LSKSAEAIVAARVRSGQHGTAKPSLGSRFEGCSSSAREKAHSKRRQRAACARIPGDGRPGALLQHGKIAMGRDAGGAGGLGSDKAERNRPEKKRRGAAQ